MQQAVVFEDAVGGVQVHQVHFVGGADEFVLGAFREGVVAVGIAAGQLLSAHRGDKGAFERVGLIQPRLRELAMLRQAGTADGEQFRRRHGLRQAVCGVGGLYHPAEDVRVGEGVVQGVAA